MYLWKSLSMIELTSHGSDMLSAVTSDQVAHNHDAAWAGVFSQSSRPSRSVRLGGECRARKGLSNPRALAARGRAPGITGATVLAATPTGRVRINQSTLASVVRSVGACFWITYSAGRRALLSQSCAVRAGLAICECGSGVTLTNETKGLG